MSSNRGKDEELRATKSLCDIATVEEKCDITRHTTTNTPDLGADLVFHCPSDTGEKFSEIAKTGGSSKELTGHSSRVRIDVKARTGKIQKDDAEKLVDDIKKHPQTNEHWLIGGSGLTKPAQRVLDSANEWATVRHFSRDDFKKISQFYAGQIAHDEE